MKILLHILHADRTVGPIYEAALRARGLDVDVVTVLPPAARSGGLSSAYAALCDAWASRRLTPSQGLLTDYRGPNAGRYGAWVVASWSAAYKLLERALASPDANVLTGVVMLDSGHAAFDSDGTAADRQVALFAALARRAVEGKALLWVGHTDVETPQRGPGAFASTTQWAAELLRISGVPAAPPRAHEAIARGLLHVQAFDERPAAEARQEHIAALTGWGPAFVADALRAWVSQAETARQPPYDVEAIRRDVEKDTGAALGERALAVALQELADGVREDPPGSNGGPRVREYFTGCSRAGKLVGLTSGSWCAAFVGWCDRQALKAVRRDLDSESAKLLAAGEGADVDQQARLVAIGAQIDTIDLWLGGADVTPLGMPCRWRASVAELVADARAAGAWHPADGVYSPAPGDLAVFKRNGQDPRIGGQGHACRVERVPNDTGVFPTIDGNYGDRVARVERRLSDPELLGWIACPRARPVAVPLTDLAAGAAALGLDRSARDLPIG